MSIFKRKKQNSLEKCSTCRCFIDTDDAYVVDVFSAFSGRRKHYYCSRCKPAFNEVIYDDICMATYYGRVQMTKDGVPVGYKKVKNK